MEKVIGDFDIEQRRLKTKQATLLTQTMDLKYELELRNLLNEEQIQRMEDLRAKVRDRC